MKNSNPRNPITAKAVAAGPVFVAAADPDMILAAIRRWILDASRLTLAREHSGGMETHKSSGDRDVQRLERAGHGNRDTIVE